MPRPRAGSHFSARRQANLARSRGVAEGQEPCAPAEHRTLDLLLTGRSEKEIAAVPGLGVGATHNRVTAIYEKFGAISRAQLMALWL